jgi:hypothetical protein
MTNNEKQEILSLAARNEELPDELRAKLIQSIKNGEKPIFDEDNYLCCTYLDTVGTRQYDWTTFDNCRIVGGRAADNSMCGH